LIHFYKRAMKKIVVFNSALSASCFFTTGLLISWSATALPSFRTSYELSSERESWLGAVGHLGALVGSLLAGLFSRCFGIRRSLQICGLLSFFGWLLVLLASFISLYLVYIGLLLIGWSCGLATPNTSIYVAQISGPGNKGVVTSVFNFNLTTGILFGNVIGALVSWIYTATILTSIHFVLFILLSFCLTVSPYEAAKTKEREEILKVLRRLRTGESHDLEAEAQSIQQQEDTKKDMEGKKLMEFLKTLDSTCLKKMAVILTVFSFSNLSGIYVMNAFIVDIFVSTGVSKFIVVVSAGLSEVVFSFIQSVIANRLGRKTLLIFSGAGVFVTSMAFAGIFFKSSHYEECILNLEWLNTLLSSKIFIVICIILYYFSINIGFAPVKYILLGEMFSPKEQESVAVICGSWLWILGFATVKVFHVFSITFGLIAVFTLISIISFFCVMFTVFFVPETRKAK